ncbi:MAG TPA: class I SAM-dependent DNA methyltransferase [Thermotogota bacterium]|nr:class I SAM-dependent DNA methyltransferase [Thermotogota bacterium]HRW34126.1 class I SAM-dependent DNA methyltransferase [Thermotogota bacterium]
MSDVVSKLWGFCHTLRHDGIDYGDYIEQLTYLLFLKMSHEKDIDLSNITYEDNKKLVKLDCSWTPFTQKSGTELLDAFARILRALSRQKGLLGDIFNQSMPRFTNPVNLKKIINMIDEEDWSAMEVDVKGAAFEGLLEKSAAEGKKGAGQYFTPRVLIQSVVNVMRPDPRENKTFTICDPACGTAGFLMMAYEWLMNVTKGALNRNDVKRIKEETFYGQELVPRPRRLALMNLFLHGLEPTIYLGDSIYEPDRRERYDCILTNPPFGTKGANQAPVRDDFTVSTSNKQLNFIQHVVTILKPGGRAAMVLPDNVLFADAAGDVIRYLMEDCNVHTVLRLPNGTFTPYSQGVKANVIFFQKGLKTENTWIYDCRTNIPGVTKKERPLTPAMFEDFEKCYGEDPNGRSKRKDLGEEGRFREFSYSQIKERSFNLDIAWLKDDNLEDPNSLPEPELLVADAITELSACVDELQLIMDEIESEDLE